MTARDESPTATRDAAAQARDELRRFELVLTEASAGFINLPAEDVDDAITRALRGIAPLLDVDRITLLRMSPSGPPVVTHSGSVPGVPEVGKGHVASYPWTTAELRLGRSISFSNVDELPPETAADKPRWTSVGVKSNVTVPIVPAGVVEGVLALACLRRRRTWTARMTHRWLADGVRVPPKVAIDSLLPWLTSEFMSGRPISGRLCDLPREAAMDVAELSGYDVRSIVVVPLTQSSRSCSTCSSMPSMRWRHDPRPRAR